LASLVLPEHGAGIGRRGYAAEQIIQGCKRTGSCHFDFGWRGWDFSDTTIQVYRAEVCPLRTSFFRGTAAPRLVRHFDDPRRRFPAAGPATDLHTYALTLYIYANTVIALWAVLLIFLEKVDEVSAAQCDS
jgi:hypothetical protein